MKTVQVKVLKEIPGFKVGDTCTVEVDPKGVPLDRAWRKRIADAAIDNAVEVLRNEPAAKKDKTVAIPSEEK